MCSQKEALYYPKGERLTRDNFSKQIVRAIISTGMPISAYNNIELRKTYLCLDPQV